MQPNHHPDQDILLRYAAATLGEGASIVIGAHLAVCASCREDIEIGETIGGAILDALEPTVMSNDAFAKVLARIDGAGAVTSKPRRRREIAPGVALPDSLGGHEIGKWRFLAPGLKFSRVTLSTDDKATVLLLRAAPGTYLPQHGHQGEEFLYVVSGSFSDGDKRYMAGDIAISDETLTHEPRIDMGGECISLVAIEGRLKLKSPIGRLLQPLFGL